MGRKVRNTPKPIQLPAVASRAGQQGAIVQKRKTACQDGMQLRLVAGRALGQHQEGQQRNRNQQASGYGEHLPQTQRLGKVASRCRAQRHGDVDGSGIPAIGLAEPVRRHDIGHQRKHAGSKGGQAGPEEDVGRYHLSRLVALGHQKRRSGSGSHTGNDRQLAPGAVGQQTGREWRGARQSA